MYSETRPTSPLLCRESTPENIGPGLSLHQTACYQSICEFTPPYYFCSFNICFCLLTLILYSVHFDKFLHIPILEEGTKKIRERLRNGQMNGDSRKKE
ncbi:hypothetical protein J4Q44_G00058550 [Coregonus suidteri]|uniref:Uncharacterized protein n=1 Tax=Coregonus suidteri TaxID=861788 RepID=A0AAN8MCV5_9TELE